MSAFLDALLPVFAMIVIGAVFQYYRFPGDAFWPLAARITYFAFFPALVLSRLALAELEGVPIVPLALALSLPVLGISVILIATKPLLRVTNPAFTSVFQGSIRFNTYVGLAAAGALLGDEGIALAAIALAVLIPLVNVLSVAVLTGYVAQGAATWRNTLLSILKNPLIIACAVGIFLNWSGIGLPSLTAPLLEIFSRAALPMGLLTVGAGLDLRAVQAATYPVAIASLLKLAVLPLLTAGACTLLQLGDAATTVAMIFAALPTAPSAYILAQQLGGDVRLMAAITTVQTVLAAATMSVAALFW